jgi:hypothetical protein
MTVPLKIAAFSLVPISLFATAPAQAFGLSDITDIGGSFAPFISNLVGFDISPYQSIIDNTQTFTKALTSGNYGAAVTSLTSTLGDYGIGTPSKLIDKSKFDATKYNGFYNLGVGDTVSFLQAVEDNKELSSQAQYDASLSNEFQQSLIKSSDGTAQLVEASSKYSEFSGKTKVSQKIFRNMSAQLAAQAAISGQSLGEQRNQGITLKMAVGILGDIRANQNKDNRKDRGQGDRQTKAAITSAALFSSMVKPESR